MQPTFDLEGLLTINYEYAPLKKVIEYLLGRDRAIAEKMAKQDADLAAAQTEIKVYVTSDFPRHCA